MPHGKVLNKKTIENEFVQNEIELPCYTIVHFSNQHILRWSSENPPKQRN